MSYPLTQDEYLTAGGMKCPACGSEDIQSGPIQFESEGYANCSCFGCKATWTDIYRLDGFDNLEE